MVDSNDQIYQVQIVLNYVLRGAAKLTFMIFGFNLKKMRRSKIFPENLRKRRINSQIDTFVKLFF